MAPVTTYLKKAGPRLGRHSACALLSMLFVLGSASPQFQALLPREPAAYAATPARAHPQPVMWFPLAYALSGLPETGWTPGQGPQVQGQAPAGEDAYVAPLRWTDPALPVASFVWWALLALLTWIRRYRGWRPRAPDLPALDPPPRLCRA